MSDFLAEMEARRQRAPRPGAPVAAVVMGFAIMVVAPFVLTILTVQPAAKVTGGAANTGEIALYVATVLGLALGAAAVVWAILYFALVRKARPAWGVPFLAGLAAAGVVFIGGASVYAGISADRNAQEEIAAAEIRQTIDGFLRDSLKVGLKSNTAKARGRYGAVEAGFKADMAEAIRLSRRYEEQMEALDLVEGAPPNPTLADLKIFEARYAEGKTLTTAYRAALKARLVSARGRFEGGAFNPGVRRNYLPGFEEQFRLKQGSLDRALDVQEDMMDLNRQQMQALVTSWGQWTADGRRVTFRRAADANAFSDATNQLYYLRWRMNSVSTEEAQQYRDFQKQVDVAGVRP